MTLPVPIAAWPVPEGDTVDMRSRPIPDGKTFAHFMGEERRCVFINTSGHPILLKSAGQFGGHLQMTYDIMGETGYVLNQFHAEINGVRTYRLGPYGSVYSSDDEEEEETVPEVPEPEERYEDGRHFEAAYPYDPLSCCDMESPNGWTCTRTQGHDGLHEAHLSGGTAMERWYAEVPEEEPEPEERYEGGEIFPAMYGNPGPGRNQCGVVSSSEWQCSRDSGHEGIHEAHLTEGDAIERWYADDVIRVGDCFALGLRDGSTYYGRIILEGGSGGDGDWKFRGRYTDGTEFTYPYTIVPKNWIRISLEEYAAKCEGQNVRLDIDVVLGTKNKEPEEPPIDEEEINAALERALENKKPRIARLQPEED